MGRLTPVRKLGISIEDSKIVLPTAIQGQSYDVPTIIKGLDAGTGTYFPLVIKGGGLLVQMEALMADKSFEPSYKETTVTVASGTGAGTVRAGSWVYSPGGAVWYIGEIIVETDDEVEGNVDVVAPDGSTLRLLTEWVAPASSKTIDALKIAPLTGLRITGIRAVARTTTTLTADRTVRVKFTGRQVSKIY